MTTNPQTALSGGWPGDTVDLDDLFRNAEPVGDGAGWRLPGFFDGDHEFDQFQAWLVAERTAGTT